MSKGTKIKKVALDKSDQSARKAKSRGIVQSRGNHPDEDKIVITAALPYANGDIHIGHLLEYIQADIFTRFLKLQGQEAIYICASDMHGTPVEVNAQKAGKEPEKFANEYWKEHQKDFGSFLIKFDNYYKTHSPENQELAELFFHTLKKKGYISIKEINTIYCQNCQRYLPDRFVKGTCPNCTTENQYGDVCENCNTTLKGIDLINPKCSICSKTPQQKISKHYFFTLGKFTIQLKSWLKNLDIDKEGNDVLTVQPEINNLLQEWITKGLEDWCISRDAPYFGFKIPGSEKETGAEKYFYVWLDAPIGYISSTKNYCEKVNIKSSKDCWEDYWKKGKVYHFIGKDIIYFHYLFWPAMLMAMEIPLPSLTAHGFITVNGQKMSKSRGTFFTAKDFLKLYPAESLRFYYGSHLDRKVIDVDLSLEEFKAVNNKVLVGSLGNFCYRVLTFCHKNYQEVKEVASEAIHEEEVVQLFEQIKTNYQQQDFKSAVRSILQIADKGNSYFQNSEVWKNIDSKESKAKVGWCVNLARNLSILISPVLPEFSQKVQSALSETELHWIDLNFTWKGKVKDIPHLAEKIETIEEHNVDQKQNSTPYLAPNYSVSSDVASLGVKVRVAHIFGLNIKKRNGDIEKLKKELEKNIQVYSHKKILDDYDRISQQTGVDSEKYLNAVAHLITLVKNKGKLPQINTVVDVYNIFSVKSGMLMATHDADKLKGDIDVRLSAKGEPFVSLDGSFEKLNSGEVIYADSEKVM
ncbi:methionine--tRNA ligase [Candidatus Woesearchaeota archaeon]|nr:methionine--tRNA ligase [Candidatus Woesearchaeota archaeon]